MSDPMKPNLALLVKLGSIAVHCDEMLSSDGHAFDRLALQSLLDDEDVKSWIALMGVFLPLKRSVFVQKPDEGKS